MEKLMQYVWQHRLWKPTDLTTVDGEAVEVLDPGLLNHDAGPDFFNAKIKIGERLWAGNVEIHVKASDWYRHGHDTDPAYSSVILHVVADSDSRVKRPDGVAIPQLAVGSIDSFGKAYREMVENPRLELACAEGLASIPPLHRSDWITSLAFERIYAKAEHFAEIINHCDGDWRTGLYVLLARALGFSINSVPFERLALATPLPRLLHHQGNLTTIEGALFGQAGLIGAPLANTPEAEYAAALCREYDFLKAKYGFSAPGNLGWKLARMRPQNFPHRRIAFLARLVSDGFTLAHSLLAITDIASAREQFKQSLSPFWAQHFTFAPSAERLSPRLGVKAIDSLIINVVVPALYCYSMKYGGPDRLNTCVELLQSLPPEDNRIVRLFTEAGIECPDAFTSQALIELRREYCEPRKCLYCRFGHRILAGR